MAMAESDDGFTWTKPIVDVIEFDGSTKNNLVWKGPGKNVAAFLDENPDATWDAKVKAVRDEIAALHAVGCRYIQLNDTNLAYLCDPDMRAAAADRGDDPNELTSMMAMMVGSQAERADQMDEDSVKKMVIHTIEKIRPAAKGKLEAVGYKSWFRDPFASGDWTNFGPGQVTQFAGKMSVPHGRIHIESEPSTLSTGHRKPWVQ